MRTMREFKGTGKQLKVPRLCRGNTKRAVPTLDKYERTRAFRRDFRGTVSLFMNLPVSRPRLRFSREICSDIETRLVRILLSRGTR